MNDQSTPTALVLQGIVNPLPKALQQCDVNIGDLEAQLDSYSKHWGLDLSPDYQRGHVWLLEQQTSFIEAIMRGLMDDRLRTIQFNATHWNEDEPEGDLPRTIQIVDGLQRLTAVRRYLDGYVKPFGLPISAFAGSQFDLTRPNYRLRFAIHDFHWRTDLLRYYLDINAGGTPHSENELTRVRNLLDELGSTEVPVRPPIEEGKHWTECNKKAWNRGYQQSMDGGIREHNPYSYLGEEDQDYIDWNAGWDYSDANVPWD